MKRTYHTFFNQRNLLLFILMLSICFKNLSHAQDSKGKDFWLMFNTNFDNTNTLTLFISSEVNTSGVVSSSSFSSIPFSITANTIVPVSIPQFLSVHGNGVIDNKGIHVTALNDITVYGLNRRSASTDAYLTYPTDALGTSYIIMTYVNNIVTGSGFGLVGTRNGTVVTITPTANLPLHPAGIPFSITLNQGQSIEYIGSPDLTGTLITSTQPIGVFGSHKCTQVPSGCPACDHLVEMLPPTTTWGKQFVTLPLGGRTVVNDQWRFIASQPSTTIVINGVPQSPVLNAGQFMERSLTTSSVITSNQPILAAQFARGITCSGGGTGDPFMVLMPSNEQFLANYTVTTVTGFATHFINVVTPTSSISSLTRNGVSIPPALFNSIGAGFSGAVIPISPGNHTLTGSLPFGAFVYGWGNADSYGYGGGQSFSPIATVSAVTLTPSSGSAEACSNHCVTAHVSDQFNAPVPGVRVDFTVTGPGTTSGFSNTNSDGDAVFCYSSNSPGNNQIQASVGTVSGTANFTWSPSSLTLNIGNNSPVCAGSTLELTATAGFNTYAWSGPNGFLSDQQNPTISNVTMAATGTYTLIASRAAGCNMTASMQITINESPTISCPANISINTEPGQCSAMVTYSAPVTGAPAENITYNFSGATVGNGAGTGSGSRFNKGVTHVTVTASNCTTVSCDFEVNVVDGEAPVANCKPAVINLAGGVATLTVNDIDNGSTDNCGTVQMALSKSQFDCSNIGTNTVTLIVTDENNNQTTCETSVLVVGEIPTCIISSIPNSAVYTGGVPTNLYLGYGATATTLAVSTPASGEPYTYSWTGVGLSNYNSSNPVFTPEGAGSFTLSVVVTNKYGCTASCSIEICVLDIREFDEQGQPTGKVFICHVPPGNLTNPQTLSISVNAVGQHLGNHASDRLGKCSDQICQPPSFIGRSGPGNRLIKDGQDWEVNVSPNPTTSGFSFLINSENNQKIIVKVIDMQGRRLEISELKPGESFSMGEKLVPGIYIAEIIQGRNIKTVKLIKQ